MTSVRRVMWDVGAPARMVLLAAIRLYRLTLSGVARWTVPAPPTCSRYAEEAIRSLGATRGVFLATRRVLRCNPFGRGGLDLVPPPRREYDTNIRRATESTPRI